jgi:integrase
MLVYLGVNTGLRGSDLLKLRVDQVRGRSSIYLRETKTNKERTIPILKHVKLEIENYLQHIKGQKYLFQPRYANKPLSRFRAYKILKKVEEKFNLCSLGTHTLRKTFGYHFYKNNNDIATLMLIFNHSTEAMTLKYIGVSQETINKTWGKWGGIKKKKAYI